MTPIVDLTGKHGLVVGIANDSSIAHGCARAFRHAGADLDFTYLNAKAEPYVRPLAQALDVSIVLPCDVREPGQLEAVFERMAKEWGRLDFLFHSIAFTSREDLQTSLANCSAEGFAMAMDVSCRGAAVKNLSHSASFHPKDKIAPSNAGTKHLGLFSTSAPSLGSFRLRRSPSASDKLQVVTE